MTLTPNAHELAIKQLFYGTMLRFVGFCVLTIGLPLGTAAIAHWAFHVPTATLVGLAITLWLAVVLITGAVIARWYYRRCGRTLLPMAGLASLGTTTQRVAHDMHGPLASLKAGLRQLHATIPADSPGATTLSLLQRSADRLERVTHDLLDTAQGGEALVVCDVRETLGHLVAEYQAQQMMSQVVFVQEYSREPVLVRGQMRRLERVCANLIKNALEAMQFTGTLTVRTHATEHGWRIEVTDTGPGISGERRAELLAGAACSDKSGGHGIGLQLVHEVLQAHQTRLEIDAVLGQGATFAFTLPAAQSGQLLSLQRRA